MFIDGIMYIYTHGKIHWAKHSRLQQYFCGPLASSVYYLTIAKYSWGNFCDTVKKTRKFSPVNLSTFMVAQNLGIQNFGGELVS